MSTLTTPSTPPADSAAMSHADRLAALTALRDAIDGHIDQEKDAIRTEWAGAVDTVTIPPTRFGGISFQPGRRPIVINEDALLAYAKTYAPDRVVTTTTKEVAITGEELIALLERVAPDALRTVVTETVPEALRNVLIADATPLDEDTFVRLSTGEPIDYATFGKQAEARVSYPASKEQKLTKLRARHAVAARIDGLTLEVTDGTL